MQAKRIVVAEETDSVGGKTSLGITAPTDPRTETNFHNIWGSISIEPENADANAQGTWVLYVLRENATDPTFTDVVVNGETNNSIMIAFGVWSATNQTPFNISIHPETSRTLQPGDQIALQSHVTGISAGAVSQRVMLSANVTRK